MPRLSETTKQEIQQAILDGVSIPRISKTLGVWKSTIYYYYKKLKGKKYISVSYKISGTETEGEILGAFAADGGAVPQSQYQVAFFLSRDERDYAEALSRLLAGYFSKPPYLYHYPPYREIILRYKSKPIYEFLKRYLSWEGKKTYSIALKHLNHSNEFYRGFLRGYLDCDGYTPHDRIGAQFFGASREMLLQIAKMLEYLGFNHRFCITPPKGIHATFYRIILKGEEAKRFLEFVSPRNKKRRCAPGRGVLGSTRTSLLTQ